MKLDICIPVYRNLKCLNAMAQALRRNVDTSDIGRVLLHVQDLSEAHFASVFAKAGFDVAVVSVGSDKPETMATYMDRLFSECKSEWVLFTEQDVFMHSSPFKVASIIRDDGYIAAGPLDTMHANSPNAIGRALYGQYMRLSPEPGFFHSSLIFLDRQAVAERSKTPFTIPAGFKMHGTGVLGGESYYGLRVNLSDPSDYMLKKDREKIRFFEQRHSSFGYAATIKMDSHILATHLYFSSTKEGYKKSGWLSESDYRWLCSEEDKFFAFHALSP
jgi:hypothetical protein